MTQEADGKWTEGRSDASIEAQRLRSKATGRAHQRLAKLHPAEFERLLAAEKAKLAKERP